MSAEQTYDCWIDPLIYAARASRLGTIEDREKELRRVKELADRCLGILAVIRAQEDAAGRRDALTIAP